MLYNKKIDKHRNKLEDFRMTISKIKKYETNHKKIPKSESTDFAEIRVNPLDILPDDCVCHIFSFLDIEQQAKCSGVCKDFSRLIKRTWDWNHQTLTVDFIITRQNKRRELVRKYYIQQIKKLQESSKKSQLRNFRNEAVNAPRGQK
mmetsp:Transcript_23271/g.32525  ORF Transcript_23271/g.32525 Transcript_23271/m.32525 type:complete len:147 (-) Transcript_23271:696-1136(-)